MILSYIMNKMRDRRNLKTHYCKCGQVACHGERRFLIWRWWCNKCYLERFCGMVESSPLLLAKYINIYKKTPREVMKDEFKLSDNNIVNLYYVD